MSDLKDAVERLERFANEPELYDISSGAGADLSLVLDALERAPTIEDMGAMESAYREKLAQRDALLAECREVFGNLVVTTEYQHEAGRLLNDTDWPAARSLLSRLEKLDA